MKVRGTGLPGVVLVEPCVHRDARGYVLEAWSQATYAAHGLPATFVQDNVTCSVRGVLRGLHYQHPHGQGKLVSVLAGAVFDVAVDIRRGSPTFGRWCGVRLSDQNQRRVYIPEGFAHGFVVTSEMALVAYKCTAPYRPEDEGRVLWNDPELDIAWPVVVPLLGRKDMAAPRLGQVPAERLPRCERHG